MSRRKIALICLAVFLLGLTGVAVAKTIKVRLKPTAAAKRLKLTKARGSAVMDYTKRSGKTLVVVKCNGLQRSTTYTVYLTGSSRYRIGTFTTDSSGSGKLRVRLRGNRLRGTPVKVVGRVSGTAQTLLRSR